MAPIKPMLGEIELQLVQKIDTEQEQVLAQHAIPALDGDFLQGLGRRASRVTLSGTMTGPEAGEQLKTLREKFRTAEPVSFVADIATATKVDEVIIEEMAVRELAGKSERFEYAIALREYLLPPARVQTAVAQPTIDELEDEIEEDATELFDDQVEEIGEQLGTIEVQVELGEGTDYSAIMIRIEGVTADGEDFADTSVTQVDGVYRFENLKAGDYTVRLEIL
jgi:hypothetical protein